MGGRRVRGGRPLAAYVRLGQYLASRPLGADRESAIERVGRARATLLLDAARFSRLITTVERRSEPDSVPERSLVRVAARDGDVSLEGLSSLGAGSPMWRRAEEIPAAPYLDLLRRVLETPVLVDEFPRQSSIPPSRRRGWRSSCGWSSGRKSAGSRRCAANPTTA